MPVYEYICDNTECSNFTEIWENFHFVDERDTEVCQCGKKPRRLISQSTGKPVVMHYYSEALNQVIRGPRHKAKLLKEMNMVESDDLKEYDATIRNKRRFEKVSNDASRHNKRIRLTENT